MVPSDATNLPNTDTNTSNSPKTISAAGKIIAESNNEIDTLKGSPFSEAALTSLENHLINLKEKALANHIERMIKIRALAKNSGMDNQQQENFIREIDELFCPLFPSMNP